MIMTTAMLLEQYSNYADPAGKIRRLVSDGALTAVTKGIYETDASVSGYVLAPVIYGPSYLSLNYALSYYGLIPERVDEYTSVTCLKLKKKQFSNRWGTYSYRDIPAQAYPYGIELKEENGYVFSIAAPEKALCDKVYASPLVGSQREIYSMLTEDMRMEPADLKQLNIGAITELCEKYRSNNVRFLAGCLRRIK